MKLLRLVRLVLAGVAVLGVGYYAVVGTVAAVARAEIEQPSFFDTTELEKLSSMPPEEREFCRVVARYAEETRAAGGGDASWSVQRRLLADRAVELRAVISGPQLARWVGVADETYAKPDSASVMIQLPCEARMATGTVLRDAKQPSQPSLYGAIADLAPGQRVVFSGTLKLGGSTALTFYNLTDAGRLLKPRVRIELAEMRPLDPPPPPPMAGTPSR